MKTFEQYMNEAEGKRPGLLAATKALVKAVEDGAFLLGQDTQRRTDLRIAVADAHNAIKQTLEKSKASYDRRTKQWGGAAGPHGDQTSIDDTTIES